jgi:hypothetical protein
MKKFREYILEVSKETAKSAYTKATSEIMDLTNKLTKVNFSNDAMVKKLQRRIRQAAAFNNYVEQLNSSMASACPDALNSLINSWKTKGIKVGKQTVAPIFILSGFDEKEFTSIAGSWSGDFISGSGHNYTQTITPTDRRRKPYTVSREHMTYAIQGDHKLTPSQLIVIIPGTENIELDSNADKRSAAYKAYASLLVQLTELTNEIDSVLGSKTRYSFEYKNLINKTIKNNDADWSKLQKYDKNIDALTRSNKLGSLENLINVGDNLVFLSIDIPTNMQKSFNLDGSVMIGADEVERLKKIYNADGSEDEAAMSKKLGVRYSRPHRYYSKGDRYGKVL